MEVEVKAARGATSLYLATTTNVVLLTGYFAVLTNILPPAEVGLVTLLNVLILGVATVSVLASPVVGAGLSTSPAAVSRFLALYIGEGRGRAARRVLLISLAVTSCVSLAAFLVLSYAPLERAIASPLSPAPVAFAGLDAVIFSLGQLGAYALIGMGRAGRAGTVIAAAVVTRYVMATIFVLHGLGGTGVFLGFCVGDLILPVVSIPMALRGIPATGASREDSRQLFGYMLSMLGSGLIVFAVSQADRLLAFAQKGLGDLAIYNVVSVGGNITAMAPIALTNVLVPILGSMAGMGLAAKPEVLRNYTRYVSFVAFPIGFMLAAVAPALLKVFGTQYVAASPLVGVMSISVAATAVSGVYSSELISSKKTYHFFLGNALALITLIAVAVVLVPSVGLLGVALGRATMLFVTLGAFAYFLKASGNLVLDAPAYAKSLASSAVMGGAIYALLFLITRAHPLGRLASVGLGIALVPLGLVIFLAVMRSLKAFNERDFEFLGRLLPRSLSRVGALAKRLLS